MKRAHDFSGWATRNDLRCNDGRIIRKDAFKHNDGQRVPLVWNHGHNDPLNVLGHAILENRDEGVYAYGFFNDTVQGQNAKLFVKHGDITKLSIYANQLKHNGSNVLHGAIREVSLVLAGANPGAYIDSVIKHGDGSSYESGDEAVIYTDDEFVIEHDGLNQPPVVEEKEKDPMPEEKQKDEIKHAEKEKTVQDVLDTLTEEQKTVMYAIIAEIMKDDEDDLEDEEENEEEEAPMKHNVFDQDTHDNQEEFLSHADMQSIIDTAKRGSSMRDAVLQHGITNIDYLFPEAKSLNTPPGFITRQMGWVKTLLGSVHHTPFSRIKSMFADLTEDEARAKGYIKGKMKKEQVFSLLKRTTTPQTIYKKQKLDRDDVIDIVDFDVVAWLKTEMRFMLDEEIARAILVGDGRLASDDDKIQEIHIRPIWKDEDLYTIKYKVQATETSTADERAKALIRGAVKSREDYRGSGNPLMFTTESQLSDCLLMEDAQGRVIYDTEEKLATATRVSKIVTTPVMEGLERTDTDGTKYKLLAIIVNPNDYNVGADKGGAVNMFDDFDIDYNAMKYLIETRCSGALTVPYSAIVLEMEVA